MSVILMLACSQAAAPVSAPEPEAPPEPAAPIEVAPVFVVSVEPIPDALAREMVGTSWREGCPTPLSELRLIRLSHWDFDGVVQSGRLVVHHEAVDAMSSAFGAAFDARFPIRSIQPVSAYGGSDDLSMAADNTSAFNCRPIKGTNRWSEHSSGKAVDVNPVENPWLSKGKVDPPEGAVYADRDLGKPGMLLPDSAMVTAFAEAGWPWGGTWSTSKDYQHFSASGR